MWSKKRFCIQIITALNMKTSLTFFRASVALFRRLPNFPPSLEVFRRIPEANIQTEAPFEQKIEKIKGGRLKQTKVTSAVFLTMCKHVVAKGTALVFSLPVQIKRLNSRMSRPDFSRFFLVMGHISYSRY